MQLILKSSLLRLCDMSSLLFIGKTGPKVAQRICEVSIVLQ